MYIAKRIIQLIPVWLAISLLAFSLSRLAPGDPARMVATQVSDGPPSTELVEQIRAELGLDQPLPWQYLIWLSRLVQGDWGISYRTGQPVLQSMMARFPETLKLALSAFVLSLLLAPAIGVLAAVYQNSFIDQLSRLIALVGASLPSFWLAYLLIMVFSVQLKWLPVAGQGSLSHLILPTLSLSLGMLPTMMRLTRSSMLDTLQEDYLRTAKAKGIASWTVIVKHALRNALLPIVTIAGMSLGHLLGGATVIEIVFAYPGLGKFLIDSISNRDYPVIQGYVLLMGSVFVLINLCVDLFYSRIDPRIALQDEQGSHA